jgi:hypothetical protein
MRPRTPAQSFSYAPSLYRIDLPMMGCTISELFQGLFYFYIIRMSLDLKATKYRIKIDWRGFAAG